MCELFAMSSREPANVNFSLEEFSKHGGLTDNHKDGWGIAYYREQDAQIIREPKPAFESAQLQFVKGSKIESTLIISHIRKATMGEAALRNSQPFCRELGGKLHTFAHNGMFPELINLETLEDSPYLPIGETDSEHAYCVLMNQMSKLYKQESHSPSLEARLQVVKEFAERISPLGPSNFLYSDSEYLFCHGDKRTHSDGMRPPGLHVLCRSCKTKPRPLNTEGLTITTEGSSQDIVLIASVPLTDEDWQPLEQGEILVLKQGFINQRIKTH